MFPKHKVPIWVSIYLVVEEGSINLTRLSANILKSVQMVPNVGCPTLLNTETFLMLPHNLEATA